MHVERVAAAAALGAVVLCAAVIGAVVYRQSTCSTCAEKAKLRWEAKSDRSDAANQSMIRMINEIRPKPVVTPEDVEYLLEQATNGPDAAARGFAASLLPELVRDGQIKNTESKEAIRSMLLTWLTDADWSNRSQAIWGLFRGGFFTDAEVLGRMRALLDDPNELVRTSARNVFSKVESGDGLAAPTQKR